jgi:hypothetical protein
MYHVFVCALLPVQGGMWTAVRYYRRPLLVTRDATNVYVTPYHPAVRNFNTVHEMAKQYCSTHSTLRRRTDELKVESADEKVR